jgi:hypothetical protein
MSESEAARWEMASLEGEIRSVKALLRELGPPTSTAAAAAASASPGGATAAGGEGAAPRQDGDGSGAGDDSAPGADSSSGGAGAQPAPASATTNSLTVAWISVRFSLWRGSVASLSARHWRYDYPLFGFGNH